MSLIKCPECGKKISDKAAVCIGCGIPMEEIFKILDCECSAASTNTVIQLFGSLSQITCISCETEYSAAENLCPKCGYPRISITQKAEKLSIEVGIYREKHGIKIKKVLEAEAAEAKRREQEEAERRAEAEHQRKDEEKRRRQLEEERKQKAEEERKHNEAFVELVRERAEQGDANCQLVLGIWYRLGYGCKKNEAEAIQWFRKAAAQGNEDAKKDLETLEKNQSKRNVNLVPQNASIGDIVKFGRYNQGHGVEPIKWKVLDRQDNKLLLISEYGLDAKPYNERYKDITWETSTLRKWLNGTFYNGAFNEQERSVIAQTRCPAARNPKYETDPGNATRDNIFLLSIPEAYRYLKSDESRMCAPSVFAKKQGVYTSRNHTVGGKAACWWWLRSPGDNCRFAALVNYDGYVDTNGYDVLIDHLCVRPALWINL